MEKALIRMLQALSRAALGTGFPFLMTTLGAAVVFFFAEAPRPQFQKAMLGFAAGVMTAASVWSLLLPAIDRAADVGLPGWLPAAVGLLCGVVFLAALDAALPRLRRGRDEDPSRRQSTLLMAAITLHNVPEGMAVGVVFAGLLTGSAPITVAGAFALTIGIAIQNFPEGAIISLPLHSEGQSKLRAFIMGTLSGVVEPIGALVTILCAKVLVPIVPYMLAFAAGAMIYVVVEELIPESAQGEHSDMGTMGFAVGFLIMMILDVALG